MLSHPAGRHGSGMAGSNWGCSSKRKSGECRRSATSSGTSDEVGRAPGKRLEWGEGPWVLARPRDPSPPTRRPGRRQTAMPGCTSGEISRGADLCGVAGANRARGLSHPDSSTSGSVRSSWESLPADRRFLFRNLLQTASRFFGPFLHAAETNLCDGRYSYSNDRAQRRRCELDERMLLSKNNLSLAVTSERALPLPAGRIERHLAGCRQGEGEPGYWNANGVNPSFYWSFANPQFWSTAPLILRSLGAVCKTPE